MKELCELLAPKAGLSLKKSPFCSVFTVDLEVVQLMMPDIAVPSSVPDEPEVDDDFDF